MRKIASLLLSLLLITCLSSVQAEETAEYIGDTFQLSLTRMENGWAIQDCQLLVDMVDTLFIPERVEDVPVVEVLGGAFGCLNSWPVDRPDLWERQLVNRVVLPKSIQMIRSYSFDNAWLDDLVIDGNGAIVIEPYALPSGDDLKNTISESISSHRVVSYLFDRGGKAGRVPLLERICGAAF